MVRVHIAELRDSWPAWLGVSLTFITVNAVLVVTAVIFASGVTAVQHGLSFMSSAEYTAVPVLLAIMICLVAGPVVGSSTRLVVDSRRGSLARLALAGATPRQVTRTVLGQLVAVSLACAVVGDILGLALVQPMLDLMDHSQRNEPLHVRIAVVIPPVAPVAANLLCVLVALVGGAGEAAAASRIPPVEALRQAQAPLAGTPLRGGARVLAVLLFIVGAATFLAVPAVVAGSGKEAVSNLLVMGFMQPFVWGALLATLAPVLVRPVTRAWTGVIPSRAPAWLLARATVTARAERLTRSVTPVMFCVGVAVGDLGSTASMAATIEASTGLELGTSDLAGFVMAFGMPLAVALAGGIGTLLAMSRQRDAELALLGVVGATGALRARIPAMEASVITGTATLLSLGMVLPAYAFPAYSLPAAGLGFVAVVPWLEALGVICCCLVVMIAATVLPTLAAQRRPEPRVIARLVAE